MWVTGNEGDQVRAGDLLGYMGDSGYGPEGTTGQFPVHLHVGIYMPLGVEDEPGDKSLLDVKVSGRKEG